MNSKPKFGGSRTDYSLKGISQSELRNHLIKLLEILKWKINDQITVEVGTDIFWVDDGGEIDGTGEQGIISSAEIADWFLLGVKEGWINTNTANHEYSNRYDSGNDSHRTGDH